MNIVLFAHPSFLVSTSMPRFSSLIAEGMKAKGYNVELLKPFPFLFGLINNKWLGYVDQYIVFPFYLIFKLRFFPKETVYVFSDQALGPWVWLVRNRAHVIHVHDFMALKSALGELSENPTSLTGLIYQKYIQRGFSKGKYFIPVSKASERDLLRFLKRKPEESQVIYNALNFDFYPVGRADFSSLGFFHELQWKNYFLHVGGNQWYKNRAGVLELYRAYCGQSTSPLPLLMIGSPPTNKLVKLAQQAQARGGKVYFQSGVSNEQLRTAYSGAALLIFPSLNEGFGWPIAEAMACNCLVLTTNEAPMTEVGGEAAFYLPRCPLEIDKWAIDGARLIEQILALSEAEKKARCADGYEHVKQFEAEKILDAYESFYKKVLEKAS